MAKRPTPLRVARRALVLTAVPLRAYLETEGAPDTADYWRRMLAWLDHEGISAEMEPAERRLVETPLGKLTKRAVTGALWRSEGLGVLAWALGLIELPPHDVETDQQAVGKKLGFLKERPTVLRSPTLRSDVELIAQGARLRAIHWRLREFGLRPKPLDLAAALGRLPTLGPVDLRRVRRVGGDLAVGGRAIARATPAAIMSCRSIAAERHQAINWLLGEQARYSQVDTPT